MVKDKVVVTGFGPFGEHQINASWEAVKLLPSYNLENIDLIIKQVQVAYEDVENETKNIWLEHKPKLTVHVGVSAIAELVTIENQAHRTGYKKVDCLGLHHETSEASVDGSDVLLCGLDVQLLCDRINNKYNKKIACLSNNAGRYLCEYIYYKSLNYNNKQSIFVHVPCLNKPFSAQKLAEILLLIIKECLIQLNCICIDNISVVM